MRTKIQLTAMRPGTTGQVRAELSGILRTCGTLCLSAQGVGIEVTSENPALRARVDELLDRLGADKTTDGGEYERFNRPIEAFGVTETDAQKILSECVIMRDGRLVEGIDSELIDSTDDKKAFLRGAFLGGGTLTFGSGYSLEFLFLRERLAEDFLALLNDLDVAARIVERKNRFVVYLKTAQEICDVLAHMGATKAVIDIQTARAERMMKAKISRECNCEVFNTAKTIDAAERAIRDIRLIAEKKGISSLDDKLRAVAIARLEDPGETLPALAARLGLSKSCVRHRLDKITESARILRLDSNPRAGLK